MSVNISGSGSIFGPAVLDVASGGGGSVSNYFTIPAHTNQSHWTYANSGGSIPKPSPNRLKDAP